MRKLLLPVILVTLLSAGIAAGMAAAPFLHFNGGDWSAGTNTAYCGVYWPRADFYCQRAG
jgi:hypothetical protein